MKDILKAISDLKINGTKVENLKFENFKKNILKEAAQENKAIIESLRRLQKHHLNTLKHNFLVALDTDYIAKRLGLPKDVRLSLRVAALLHDIGKLDIHAEILNNISYGEQKEVWREFNKGDMPKGNLLYHITLRQIVKHKAKRSSDPRAYEEQFESWLRQRRINEDEDLSKFMDSPTRDYLNYHQEATRRILSELGLSEEIIEYAASHHPSYFTTTSHLPKEARIIEIADKFNAIIQSEGIREYISRSSVTEAFDIIVQELREEFAKGYFRTMERRALGALVSKYLPLELEKDILPKAKGLIKELRRNSEIVLASKAKEAMRIVAIISATLSICNEFRTFFDRHTIKEINELNRIKHVLKLEFGLDES
mgnify:CR=1 FL=1